MTAADILEKTTCFHCHSVCEEAVWFNGKSFCCDGCRTVYEILDSNHLCDYYSLSDRPGRKLGTRNDDRYLFLDDGEVKKQILLFDSPSFATARFNLPAIHCVSCIWLLENLRNISAGIVRTEVNFAQKTVVIDYDPSTCKLSAIADLLHSLGYAPRISLDAKEGEAPGDDRALMTKVALAGFCFGNIMLLSFPEYLGFARSERNLTQIFSGLNIALSLPVFFYSGWDYMRSALNAFRRKQINIDVPIAIGLVALFLRSLYETISASGPGYLDSLAGLVFFLLIGRWFQSKTYAHLAFDRDYKSYFPLAVNRRSEGEWKPTLVCNLRHNDIIRLRSMEVVPADCTLLDSIAMIDYSFVTGESRPVRVDKGQLVYAGGKVVGGIVNLNVEKETSQSHLTSLWNHDSFSKPDAARFQTIIDRIARTFTWAVFGIALFAALYWYRTDPRETWLVLTSVLMVACPCALALAAPFTFGSTVRAFGRRHLYLKNSAVVEKMAKTDSVIFDKTGTVTHGSRRDVSVHGAISEAELHWIKALAAHSTHPLSKQIYDTLEAKAISPVSDYVEIPGQGIEGVVEGHVVRLGSPSHTGVHLPSGAIGSTVTVSIDTKPRGYFAIATNVRHGFRSMVTRLGERCLGLLSGDRDSDRNAMKEIFPSNAMLLFNQTPEEKLQFVTDMRKSGKKILMVGDGLNDAGALKESDVGIAITDDTGVFTPACDGILQGDRIGTLDKYLGMARVSVSIVKISFGISFVYNGVALSFAVTGHLTPLVAAILMPASSISVVAFATLAVNFMAKQKLGKVDD